MSTLSTNKVRYDELMKNPLLFLHRVDRSYTDYDGTYVERITWEPVDQEFDSDLGKDEVKGNCFNYELVVSEPIADGAVQGEAPEKETIYFNIHPISASNINDWRIVINSYIIRSQTPADRYPYIHLLWMLNYRQWNSEDVVKALSLYDVTSQPYIIKALSKISKCLSVDKQQQMRNALASFNYKYEIYSPAAIKEAINHVTPIPNGILEKGNVFRLVDVVLKDDEYDTKTLDIDEQTQNAFLCLYRWLHNEDAEVNYSSLNSIYSLSSHEIQMDIVKRYFHDIRLGKTTLDTQLLEQFRESRYSDFIRFRYCLYSPDEPINLSVPLLCDSLLTVQQTQGEAFQTFDGVMDFVMTNCDVTKPSVRLGMEEFLPRCDGGAIINKQFNGFIDFSIVFELDESKFTKENLLGSIRWWLDRRSHHLSYPACGYDKERRPLSEEMKQHCLSTRIIEENTPNGVCKREVNRFACSTICQDENKWVVYDTDYRWLNHFLKEPMPEVGDNHQPNETHIIDIEQTSPELMEKYLRSWANSCKKADEKRFVIGSDGLKSLLVQYSKPIAMRIIPQSLPLIGWDFDVFGIRKALCEEKNIEPSKASDEVKLEFKAKESSELKKRVIETLKEELDVKEFDGDFFEVPYDRELLRKLKDLYYFKGSMPESPKVQQIEFLTSQKLNNFRPFCAPKLSEGQNKATGLPFFWCRGLECFHNCLKQQTLENCPSWHKYSLYHMVEIMGFPKLRETEAGFEPDETIVEFIACANRVMKKFRRLKCRACGHLMYTYRLSTFNRHNNYSCINPTCSEYNHPVYLSYCYKCKTGLIDSRDSAKCPNGWYICPTCLSCCDDGLYDRQAQRYTLQNQPVPFGIQSKLGQGHNDKGIYYCHKCGTQLQYYIEDEKERWICPQCNVEYKNQKQLSTPFAGC